MTTPPSPEIKTNNHTYFFREAETLTAICADWRARSSGRTGPLRVWSAGCATGEEVYSLAIIACEADISFQILGTDINPRVIEAARRGSFASRRLRHVSQERKARWFVPSTLDEHVVSEELKSKVSFGRHDLTTDAAPDSQTWAAFECWDVILCRNVFLYINQIGVTHAVNVFDKALADMGLLFFGATDLLSAKLQSQLPHHPRLEMTHLDESWGFRKTPAFDRTSDKPASIPTSAPRASPTAFGRAPSFHSRAQWDAKRATTEPPALRAKARLDQPMRADEGATVEGSVAELRINGDQLLNSGDSEGALRHYTSALREDNLAIDLHLRVGLCHLQIGDTKHARQSLRRCLFLEPHTWPAAILLADMTEAEEPSLAIRYLRQAKESLESHVAVGGATEGPLEPFFAGRSAALEAIRQRLAFMTN